MQSAELEVPTVVNLGVRYQRGAWSLIIITLKLAFNDKYEYKNDLVNTVIHSYYMYCCNLLDLISDNW